MASFPGLCKAVGPAEEENGELDGSLQQMLKAIADERNRLNIRQEISGLGELIVRPLLSVAQLVLNSTEAPCCLLTLVSTSNHLI